MSDLERLLRRAKNLTGEITFLPDGEDSIQRALCELHAIQVSIIDILIAQEGKRHDR